MKLNTLTLKNFRRHRSTTIPLSKVNWFTGRNGQGKTSILDAIEYALTGRCQHLGGKGETADELIHDGEKKATVTLETSMGTITRDVPNALQINELKGNTTFQQGWLLNTLGMSEDAIRAALRSWTFLAMKPTEQKELLFDLLGVSVDEKTITEHLGESLAQFWAQHGTGAKPGGEYDYAFAERKGAKATLAHTKAKFDGIPTTPEPPPVPAGALDEMRDKWRSVTKQIAELEAKGLAGGDIHKLKHAEWERLKERSEFLASAIASKTAAMEQLEAGAAFEVPKVDDLLKQLDELRREEQFLEGEGLQVRTIMADCLNTEGPCPEGSCLRMKLKALQAEADGNQAERQAMRQKIQKLESSITSAHQHSSRKADIEEFRKSILDMQGELKKTKPGKEPKAETSAEASKELDILRGTLADIEAEGKAFEAARGTHGIWKQQQAERTRLQADLTAQEDAVEKWEKLVEAFGPKGIKAQLLAEALAPLQEVINESLIDLGGFRIAMEVEDANLTIWAERDGHKRRFSHLSKSEQLRVGIGIQCGLNALTNLGILVIDDVDGLDEDIRETLLEVLLQVADQFETILVFEATTQPRHVEGLGGVAFFNVNGGQVAKFLDRKEVSA